MTGHPPADCGNRAESRRAGHCPLRSRGSTAWLGLQPAASGPGPGWFSQYKQLTHCVSLLSFLLTIIALLLTLCLVQLNFLFKSQSTLQETTLRDLSGRLEKLNRSYLLLFSQYPALNQYCPINTTTTERQCRPCLDGWLLLGDKCLLFSQDRADWISSQYHCMALGGAVVTVRTEEEQCVRKSFFDLKQSCGLLVKMFVCRPTTPTEEEDEVFLFNEAQRLSHGDSYWLRLRRSRSDGLWQWGDGSQLEKGPEFWERESDKSGQSSVDLCGRLTPGGDYSRSWYTSGCSTRLRRICERRKASLQ
ncbi:uncharacterized protein KZ484_007464 [Pholidichthys leucotaenia]